MVFKLCYLHFCYSCICVLVYLSSLVYISSPAQRDYQNLIRTIFFCWNSKIRKVDVAYGSRTITVLFMYLIKELRGISSKHILNVIRKRAFVRSYNKKSYWNNFDPIRCKLNNICYIIITRFLYI